MFSAVALVAFSFAGMANEIEEKNNKTELELNEKEIEWSFCERFAQNVFRNAVWDTGSQVYAQFQHEQAKSVCELLSNITWF